MCFSALSIKLGVLYIKTSRKLSGTTMSSGFYNLNSNCKTSFCHGDNKLDENIHTIQKPHKPFLVASKVGPDINPEDATDMFMLHQQNASQNHNIKDS
jgi:hypothetical protein